MSLDVERVDWRGGLAVTGGDGKCELRGLDAGEKVPKGIGREGRGGDGVAWHCFVVVGTEKRGPDSWLLCSSTVSKNVRVLGFKRPGI